MKKFSGYLICTHEPYQPTAYFELLRTAHLVRQQQTDSLQTLLSSINVITQEEIVCLGRESTVFKQSQQVVVLSVNISADLDGSFQFQQDWLCDEDFPCFRAEELDFVL
jgi:hypothetical protein